MIYFKEIIGLIAVALTFAGYAPYIRDIFRGKTTPHIFTWIILAFTNAVVYALQVTSGAGAGSWVTLSLVAILSFIAILSFKKGCKDIRMLDVAFLALAALALPLWLIVKQPTLSVILLSLVCFLGFVPTVRKSWHAPYSETLSFYVVSTFRHGLSVLALEHYSLVTALYPSAWILANALFAVMLMIRRRQERLLVTSFQ